MGTFANARGPDDIGADFVGPLPALFSRHGELDMICVMIETGHHEYGLPLIPILSSGASIAITPVPRPYQSSAKSRTIWQALLRRVLIIGTNMSLVTKERNSVPQESR